MHIRARDRARASPSIMETVGPHQATNLWGGQILNAIINRLAYNCQYSIRIIYRLHLSINLAQETYIQPYNKRYNRYDKI